jgi:catalase
MATSKENGYQAAEYGDQRVGRGDGGETHQAASGGAPRLTTQQGIVVSDDQNTLRSGVRGPAALEDFHFREKIFHFDHERIPERVVHARGYGAHGYFENYEPLTDITRADPFSEAGLRTPVFVRFSTVAGNKGSTDLARDVRGFATKFYTREGNWDLVGNNIPVFFIQDAIKFPDVIHAVKQEPDRGFPQAQSAHNNFWDFVSLLPESTHMLMWVMSDRAIPRSFRFMEGFGVHTFRLVNAEGRSTFVKFHWKPKLGMQSVVWNEALKISGADPDFHRRDLWDAITQGDFPEWELGLQLFDEDFADRFAFDVLDSTKIIPEELVPVRLLHPEHRPRHRLHQRPAAAGPQLLLPGHPAQAAGQPQLHPPAGQRAQVPDRALPAGRPHGHDQPGRPGQLRTQLVGPARSPRRSGGGLPHLPGRAKERGRPQAPAAAGELR